MAETSQVLREEGFDVVARLDVDDYLVRTLHHECRRYRLIQALAPELTLEALQHDRASEQVAQALDRLQRTARLSPPVVQS